MILDAQDDFQARVEQSGLSVSEYTRREAQARQRRVYGDPWGIKRDYLKVLREKEQNRKEQARIAREKRQEFRRSWEQMVMLAIKRQMESDLGIPTEKPRILVQHILLETAKKYKLHPQDITGPSRARYVVQARQEVFWRSRHEIHKTLPEIARIMGGFDHTTVLHGVRNYQRLQRIKAGLEQPQSGLDANRTWNLIIPMEVE